MLILRKFAILPLLWGILSLPAFAAKHTIKGAGAEFSPDTLNAAVGDEVVFELTGDHVVIEVSQSHWIQGFSISNGGFKIPSDGGVITLTSAGTFYYVCGTHVGHGMKGIIVASAKGSSVAFDPELLRLNWNISPNPAHHQSSINIHFERDAPAQWRLSDAQGRVVRSAAFELKPGDNTLPIDAEDIPAGIYTVQLWINGRAAPGKKLLVE